MKTTAHFYKFVSLVSLACSGSSKPQPPMVSVPLAGPPEVRVELESGAWFQPNGSIVVVDTSGNASPELSAPIAPCVTALVQDGYYPPVREEQERMADAASLTFPYFLEACAQSHELVRAPAGQTLTPEQARQNYENIARCTYETHYGKPYWVPQLIADVDVCGRALGPDWELPTRESLARFNEEHRRLLLEALKDVPFGGGYNSIVLFAREANERLTLINLAPPGAQGETPSIPVETKQSFQASGVSLRCMRKPRTLPAVDLPPVRGEAAGCGAALSAMFGPQAVEVATAAAEQEAPVTDPAILRLMAHAQALEQDPSSFDAKVTLRELERVAPSAMKAYASGPPNERERRAELEKLGARYLEVKQTIEDPKTSASERAALLPEFQRLHATLVAEAERSRSPRLTPEQRVLNEALRSIRSLVYARFQRLHPEYKHWLVAGKPIPGKTRSLAAIEQEATTLRTVAEKIAGIRGEPSDDRLRLPPRSMFKRKKKK